MKRRSAAKTNSAQLSPVHLLLDEGLAGARIIHGLREHGIPVTPSHEVTRRGASDLEILDALSGLSNHCLLARDSDFRYHKGTKERIRTTRAGVFVITAAGNKSGAQIVDIVVNAWGRMQRIAEKARRPFIARVNSTGVVKLQ